MASYDDLNFSLRPSKSIQRMITFEATRRLQNVLKIEDMVYVGLGSIWFTDYILAHKMLNIDKMYSIEDKSIGYARARFNKPFAHVYVRHGRTNDILPRLFKLHKVKHSASFVWLDYDSPFNVGMTEDIHVVLEEAKERSIFIITFNANEEKYGRPIHWLEEFRSLFGETIPDTLTEEGIQKTGFQQTIADLVIEFMKYSFIESGRDDVFIPAFRIIYEDTTPMVTVGGIISDQHHQVACNNLISAQDWRCMPEQKICAPNLTLLETIKLRSQYPRTSDLTRTDIKSLGFDLEKEQIDSFGMYYQEFPFYSEIVG